MAGFQYEKNLPHQEQAMSAVLGVFNQTSVVQNGIGENPTIQFASGQFLQNIDRIQRQNGIHIPFAGKAHEQNVLDIAMETGTGKTYTYTKTLFELHRQLGIYKFIIVVPTVSIKAGTQNFLKSPALRQHFRSDFAGRYGDAEIELYVVESRENKKSKSAIPDEIVRFVHADNPQKIHILLINSGMINSDTMKGNNKGNDGSHLIKDLYDKPFEAIASVKPFVIVDEPHKFASENKTWKNILKFQPAFILRYGATFKEDFRHLLYRLTAVDAFNQDLVKGIRVFVEDIQGEEKTTITFLESDGTQAIFELRQGKNKLQFTLGKNENLSKIHPHIEALQLENLNKTTAVLSNGLELKKGDHFNPYSYSQTVFDKMIRQAVREHFKLEQEFFLRKNGKIKPLTLFFIDDIAGYREGNAISGSLKNRFERYVEDEVTQLLQQKIQPSYRLHLERLLTDISASHGGYFSKDNSTKDEKIEKEVEEILHDKEALLSFSNPRRFIFSKWTLREGWDNPNVFQICKLRSSGSETSKLQEVGRGLRLPVNEYMGRVKDDNFMLNYFVDSSEQEFVTQLTKEVNSTLNQNEPKSLDNDLIEKIRLAYPQESKRSIGNALYKADLIDDNDQFIGEGFNGVKSQYPLAFVGSTLKIGKIREAGKSSNKVAMREGKYAELKALWEQINQKALLRYEIENEAEFEHLLIAYLNQNADKFTATGIQTKVQEIRTTLHSGVTATEIETLQNDVFEPIVTLSYSEFLNKLAQLAFIQLNTLHRAFQKVKDKLDICRFLNEQTIYQIKQGFDDFLLHHSFSDFQIGYQHISGTVHPTKFTDEQGNPLNEVSASDLGVQQESTSPLANYLFESVFFDSELERINITQGEIQEVIVFTKIPKNSIKIPVAGGKTYSPDFAYIVKTKNGEILNLILESKGVKDSETLRLSEQQKIKHAEKMFEQISQTLQVKFSTQFEGEKVVEIVKKYL